MKIGILTVVARCGACGGSVTMTVWDGAQRLRMRARCSECRLSYPAESMVVAARAQQRAQMQNNKGSPGERMES